MPTAISTTVEPLDGNKVRHHVAVPAAEFEKAIDKAFRELAREVKIDGFRPGKAPRRILEARIGTDLARERALRDALPNYYADAVTSEDLDTIAVPEIDITAGVDDGDVEFDAVVELRPEVTLDGYRGLRVEVPSSEVADAQIDEQVDALRQRFADLEDSAAPLSDGDYAEIDIRGYVHDEEVDALTATDFLYEVGSEALVPKLDDEVRGKRPGEILKFVDQLPERFGDRAGEEVAFQVLVKEAKRKLLPDITDDWASEVSEHDTVEALRGDIRTRLELMARIQSQMAARDRVLETAAALVDVEIPEAMIEHETEHRLHDLAHRLEERGATIPQYLEATGQDERQLVAAMRDGALKGVRADLALRAVVAQENIEATDDDVQREIDRLAERLEQKPGKVRTDLARRGALEAIASDISRSKALQFLVDQADVVDEDGSPVDLTIPPGGTVGDDGDAAAPAEDEVKEEQES
ncbi:MAG: trigger factor [Acidimicrobiia bacterium]